ncbi:MAG: terpene cyclase/mutase family protein [Planctomyces sp.]|nr:terpene cyclase/mutase family protein [Planctomyces sp.]
MNRLPAQSRAAASVAGPSRRRPVLRSAVAALTIAALLATPIARGQPAPPSVDSRRHYTPETQAAVERGLAWLASRQRSNGSFDSGSQFGGNPGVVGLCGLAFLSSGSAPGRGPYGRELDRAIDYVLSCTRSNGYIAEEWTDYYHGPMYGHGFATLFLAEVYGTTQREDVGQALRRAVQLIVDTQNDQGGWRYFPRPEEADVSVTVCQAMALRAARNAGIAVPRETIDRSVAYIRGCQNPDGGFRYRLFDPAESRLPLTAASLVALYTSGIHEGPELERGRAYVRRRVPGSAFSRDREYYFYGQYYATQAAWQAGGDLWDLWYPAVRDELLARQSPEGSWSEPGSGRDYQTAMALVVLQVPTGYLPILQR